MSRWIEVEPLMDKAKEYGGYYEDTVYAVPLADIEDAPSLDLVRCGECRHCLLDIVVQRREDGYERAINLCRCPKHKEEWSVDKDWYCADAERRESK